MSTKKTAGQRQNEVWEYFIKTPLNSHGNYSAECNFCKQRWGRAYVQSLQAHLANNCPACPDMIQRFYLEVLSTENLAEDITSTNDFYENKELSEGKIEAINIALVRAFVCCGIPFSVIDNLFFRELLYQLQANYHPPSRQTLAGQLLSKEYQNLLSNAAETFSIRGGGLQPFVKTRWTSIYESTNSILRMQFALNEIVRNHSNEITSKSVKKILRRRDVFVQIIRLSYKLKNMNNNDMTGLQQHAINAFNKRWDEFEIGPYILAYFLDPAYRDAGIKKGKYQIVVKAASEIWQKFGNNKASLEILLSQMRLYKLYKPPYNEMYVFSKPIVPNHQVFVVIENFFELNEVPFVLDPDDIDDNDGSSLENNMNDEVGESNEDCTNDYDLDDVVQNYVD
ncbi:5323_t:CDS:2 [Entrophospora sp. SA101]|nr:5323_t:CDS:2 [Entrophospora sp. SA101]